ncbi:hypothetical protein B0H14DRAFT_3861395 [Mycena olivaceomarginata]|nr:hypothetical protein B0H14DRAFT_3861395 [Mycena olivaceomarginata]
MAIFLSTTAMALSLALPGPACVLGSLSFFLVVNDGFQHIDLGFLKDNGHTYLDDDQFTLAGVLPGPNPDKPAFHYIYDLVGRFSMLSPYILMSPLSRATTGSTTSTSRRSSPPPNPTGNSPSSQAAALAPREDGQGFRNWSKYIQSLEPTKHAEITRAMNYRDDPRRTPARVPLAVRPQCIRPYRCARARRRGARLARERPLRPQEGRALRGPERCGRGRGQRAEGRAPHGRLRRVPEGRASSAGAAFQTEVVRDKRDKRAGALCACCGKPITVPRMCAACRKVYYCDRGCQATHWKKEHKRLCAGRNATAD